MPRHRTRTLAATAAQREALTSPLRLEILGQFTEVEPLSVRDLAERMGRSPHSIYYHVHLMARAGLLREVGRRARGPRREALYRPVRPTITLDASRPEAGDAIRRTMAAAFRMAARDLDAALESGRHEAVAKVPILATRLHFRAGPGVLKEVRGHLEAALRVLEREARGGARDRKTGALHSLTLALLPLRGRTNAEADT